MQQTPRKPERPVLWIVAGPNGSGKSSLYNRTDIEGWGGSVWIINPDLLTASIVENEGKPLDEANLAAVNRVEAWLYSSLEVYQTIGVETVLSSAKYRRLVETAKGRGFVVNMIFVTLMSGEDQLARIRIRVSEGGHDVPADRALSRRRRSFGQLAWFFGAVDHCWIYVNSGAEPELSAVKGDDGRLYMVDRLPDDLLETLSTSSVAIDFLA